MRRVLLLFLLVISVAFGEVKTQLSNMKIVKDGKGGVEAVEPKDVSPGDILEYTFTIDNQEEEAIKNLNPTIPVPNGTTIVPDTGNPTPYVVSINGRDYYPYPIEVDGNPVELSSYKNIGWNVDELKPGERVEFKVQVKLNGGEQ